METVKNLSSSDLRSEFNKRLKEVDPEKDSSAHLGLFQMALNSNAIECYFYELENGELFFLVELSI